MRVCACMCMCALARACVCIVRVGGGSQVMTMRVWQFQLCVLLFIVGNPSCLIHCDTCKLITLFFLFPPPLLCVRVFFLHAYMRVSLRVPVCSCMCIIFLYLLLWYHIHAHTHARTYTYFSYHIFFICNFKSRSKNTTNSRHHLHRFCTNYNNHVLPPLPICVYAHTYSTHTTCIVRAITILPVYTHTYHTHLAGYDNESVAITALCMTFYFW